MLEGSECSEIHAGDTWVFLEDAWKVLRLTTLLLWYY